MQQNDDLFCNTKLLFFFSPRSQIAFLFINVSLPYEDIIMESLQANFSQFLCKSIYVLSYAPSADSVLQATDGQLLIFSAIQSRSGWDLLEKPPSPWNFKFWQPELPISKGSEHSSVSSQILQHRCCVFLMWNHFLSKAGIQTYLPNRCRA